MSTNAHTLFLFTALCFMLAGEKCLAQFDSTIPHPQRRNLPPLPVVPQYPGGKDSLALFLKKHTRYPASAKAHHISGIIEVDFVVAKNGQLSKFHVYKPLGYGCDKEAIRVAKKMPRWIPAMVGRDTIELDFHVNVPFGEPDKK